MYYIYNIYLTLGGRDEKEELISPFPSFYPLQNIQPEPAREKIQKKYFKNGTGPTTIEVIGTLRENLEILTRLSLVKTVKSVVFHTGR